MITLKVSGTPMEMGRTQGSTTVEKWVDLLDQFSRIHIPESLQSDIVDHCPRQMDRMLGIAAGAAVTVDVVLMALFTEVVHAQVGYYIHGCTSFAVRGDASGSGEPVIASNLDFPRDWGYEFFARLSEPSEGFNSIEITSGPLSGSRGGVNEKGLAISYNFGHALDKADKLVPVSILVQEALEGCENTEQALEYFENSPRAGGALLMMADESGDIASLELTPHVHGVRRPDKDSIAHTNHYHVPRMAAIDVPHEAAYSDEMPELLRGESVRESSESRYERLVGLLENAKTLDEKGLVKIMSDHGGLGTPSDETICRHGPYYVTANSILLYPARKIMKAAAGRVCESEFKTIGFE